MTDGVSAVLSRIQDIQSRIATVTPGAVAPAVTTTTPASTGADSAAGSDFADSLSSAIGQGWTAGGSDTSSAVPSAVSSSVSPAVSTSATAGAPSGTQAAGGLTGERVVEDAKRYLGVPYVWGGTDPKSGLDCSGLVQQVYQDLGIDLPRVSRDQARVGRPVSSVAAARPGDIVAFGSPVDHVGIYVGDGTMIAAPYPGKNVRIEPLPSTPTAIRRVLPDTATRTSWSSVSPAGSAGRTPYAGLFDAATEKYDLPDGLLAAVAKAESGFDADAVSGAGARGLMQLMPATAQGLGVDPFAPAQAVDGAARLLRSNLRDFGSVPLALAAYNAGPGAVRRYGGIPPYAETQAYVSKVQTYQKELA